MGQSSRSSSTLKKTFQTFKSFTPIQQTTRTDRMKFLLPILLISLAALCNIQPAAAQEGEGEAPVDEIDTEPATANTAQGEAQIEAQAEKQDEAAIDQLVQVIADGFDQEQTDAEKMTRTISSPCYGSPHLTYRQCNAARKAARFFKYADTNNTGQLTWSEFWTAVYKIMARAGRLRAAKKHYYAYKKTFYWTAARSGYKYLASWRDIKIFIKARVH